MGIELAVVGAAGTRFRTAWVRVIAGLIVVIMAFPATALAGSVLLRQSLDNGTWFASYVDTDGVPNTEAADDFDIIGDIDRVVFSGRKGATAPILGLYVRFYAASATGGPGPLLKEYQLNAGDAGLTIGVDYVDVLLPTVFAATGHHFVSVQIISTTYWESGSANFSTLATKNGERVHQRSDNGAWTPNMWSTDMAMTVYGTVTGAPSSSTISPTTATRSGYIEIAGAGFGEQGQVMVGGVPAHIAFWSNSLIKAYVDESTPLGGQNVVVQTANGSGVPMALTVTERSASERLLWQFQLVGPYSLEKPAVGTDGTVYIVDVSDYLYALTPSGALKWVRAGAGGGGFDVAPDGTIYAGTDGVITAHDSDGNLKWRFPFAYPYRFFDVAAGPDGNVYVGTSGGDLGVFSLTSTGQLRWNTPLTGVRGQSTTGREIAFGFDGNKLQFYVDQGNGTSAYSSDGEFLFSPLGRGPAVSSSQLLHTNYGVFRPDGTAVCTILDGLSGFSIGADRLHWAYGSDVIAYDEDCNETKRFAVPNYVNQTPALNSTASFILTGSAIPDSTTGVSTQISYALDARNGVELWRQTIPQVEGQSQPIGSSAIIAADDSVAYFHTFTSGAVIRGFLSALSLTGTTTGGGGNGGGNGGGGGDPVPNGAPVANDDSATVVERSSVKVNVLSNDTDPEGDALRINSATSDRNVNVQINSDQTLTIKPRGKFVGTGTVVYDVVDTHGNVSNQATVTVTVVKK